MEDLLHARRRRRTWQKWAAGVVIGLAVVVLAYTWWGYVVEGERAPHRAEEEIERAKESMHQAVSSARRPIEVEQSGDDTSRTEAWKADWSEGESKTLRGRLDNHASVIRAIQDRGVPIESIRPVVQATSEAFDFSESQPEDEWMVEVADSGRITRFRYKTSPTDIWETSRNSNGELSTTKIDVPVERREVTLSGRVNRSLWKAVARVADEGKLVYRFADIFAYTVDFNRETKPGDRFAMVVEKLYLKGRFLRYGEILAAEYVNEGERYRGFHYEAEQGDESGYYTASGENLKRQFLKSPIASIRVTSEYGMRFHPVAGERKMHRGVDYGAPVGTDVRAVADATVTFAARKGANGNLVVLEHSDGYETLYAHLSEIENGIEPGAEVERKRVIGEVGSTGRSTGPHLHFGMKRNGEYVDPMEVEFARGEPLTGPELERFKREVVAPMTERLEEAGAEADDNVNLAGSEGGADEG